MGTWVIDGNSCIGCECLEEFPVKCAMCKNLKTKIGLIVRGSDFQAKLKATEAVVEAGIKLKEVVDSGELDGPLDSFWKYWGRFTDTLANLDKEKDAEDWFRRYKERADALTAIEQRIVKQGKRIEGLENDVKFRITLYQHDQAKLEATRAMILEMKPWVNHLDQCPAWNDKTSKGVGCNCGCNEIHEKIANLDKDKK